MIDWSRMQLRLRNLVSTCSPPLPGLLALGLLALGCGDSADATQRGDLDASSSDAGSPDAAFDSGVSEGASPLADTGIWDAGPVVPCTSSPTQDGDSDGFAAARDCNDCDPAVNPAAYDVPGNGVDEDCSGRPDDEAIDCDPAGSNPADDAQLAARALGVCRVRAGDSWGIEKAEWVYPDGSKGSLAAYNCQGGLAPHPLSRSVQQTFGSVLRPTQGATMTVLSSGVAQAGSVEIPSSMAPAEGISPDGAKTCRVGRPPAGFPKSGSPSCPGLVVDQSNEIYDALALELTLKVPSNARALSFDFNFMTSEFPRFVCASSNDQFVALLRSSHPLTPADENISFDAAHNLVSVNNAFLEVCAPATIEGRSFACARGVASLAGTGFVASESSSGTPVTRGGATGWLTTTASVVPGETIRLRFAIWDAGDEVVDSSVLLDNLRWETVGSTVPAGEPPSTDRVILL